MKNKKIILIAIAALVGFCVLCSIISLIYSRTPQGISAATASSQTKTSAPTETAPPTAAPTSTPGPTSTKAPTDTPEPTNTRAPTHTPPPTSTSTPEPQPIILNGSGDQVLDITKWEGPAYLHVVGPAVQDNFILHSYDANGESIDLLINTIGAYDGYQIIDVRGEQTARLQVEAGGAWSIELFPFTRTYVPTLELPGKYEGTGDAVFVMVGGKPDLANISTGSDRDNFVVYSYGIESGIELLVNEISPYSGTVIVPSDAFIVSVLAGTNWSIDISNR